MIRRAVDIVVASIVVAVTAPAMLVIALLVRWRLGAPVIFRQQRPGLHGKPFIMFKFRTLTDARDEHGNVLSDEARATRLGRFLRSTSLDELPEFLNVLKGDMSLVGPRPLMMQYLGRYSPAQARRHEVKPGVTGLAQVTGRNALTWEEKFALDVRYVDDQSFRLDCWILAKTVSQVLKFRDAAAEGFVSAPEFMGTAPAEHPCAS